jgi:hypothetical protein
MFVLQQENNSYNNNIFGDNNYTQENEIKIENSTAKFDLTLTIAYNKNNNINQNDNNGEEQQQLQNDNDRYKDDAFCIPI